MDDVKRSDELEGWREADLSAAEPRETRERRLKIRCWRRGTKEMDLILGRFLDRSVAALSDEELAAFEALIREDDGALYRWVAGSEAPPEAHAAIIERIRADHGADAASG